MKIEIQEFEWSSTAKVEAKDFPGDGLFHLKDGYNMEDLVWVIRGDNTLFFICTWPTARGVLLLQEAVGKESIEILPPETISESTLLKTIAMLANKEKLSEL